MGKNPYFNEPVQVGSEQFGYLFDVEVIIAEQVVAVVQARANTFEDAKEMVHRVITTRPADRMIPTILLDPHKS